MMRDLLFSKLTRERLDAFVAARASGGHTLDIGSANSPYARYFPNRVSLDIEQAPGVDVVGDAHELPFPDETFDVVLATEVLEHLHTPQKAADEMRRVLKSGGSLILSTRFLFPIHDAPGDYFRFTKYGLRHLFRDWDIVSLEEESTTAGTFGVLLQRVGFQTDMRLGIFSKALVLLLSRIPRHLGFMIRKEYGMRSGRGVVPEHAIMTSGYYLEARKR